MALHREWHACGGTWLRYTERLRNPESGGRQRQPDRGRIRGTPWPADPLFAFHAGGLSIDADVHTCQ